MMKKEFLLTLIAIMIVTAFSVCFADLINPNDIERFRPTNSSVGLRPSTSSKTVISSVAYTIEAPTAGKPLPSTFKYKVNQSSTEPTVVIGGDYTNIEAKWDSNDETAKAGSKYTLSITHSFEQDVYDLSDFKTTINGNEVPHPGLGGAFMVSYTFEIPTSTFTRPITGSTVTRKISIKQVDVTVDEPVEGKTKPSLDSVKFSDGIENAGNTWVNKKSDAFMTSDEEYKAGESYTFNCFFKIKDNYAFVDGFKVTINGKEVTPTAVEENKQYKFSYDFTAKSAETTKEDTEVTDDSKEHNVKPQLVLDTIDIEISVPEVGKALPSTYSVKSNLVAKASEYKIGEKKEDNLGEWSPADKEVKTDTKYIFTLAMELKNSMAEISKDLKITLNKKEIKPTIKDGVYTIAAAFEASKVEEIIEEQNSGEDKPKEEKTKEEEMINHFAFEIATPKIGEKPATTAKATKEGYKVKKVEWLTKDEKFVEGETYRVQIYFDVTNKNVRSDYYATVNGIDADLPDGDANLAKNTMYAEHTFPTLRDESKTITWSNASPWAIDDLSKASSNGLIPDSLNKEDLTKNVTRKEFAHIAVRLYETLSGKGIFVTHAPFSDTDDIEVAKAYTVGITAGVTETTFAPDKEITREQMATMMTRALEKAYVDTFVDIEKTEKFVDDEDLHDWSRAAVYFMNGKGIIKGISTTEKVFGAKGTATREQALLVSARSAEEFANK